MDLTLFAILKSYVNAVALHGVPVKTPMIDPQSRHWLIFDPAQNAYIDTGVAADGGAADLSGIYADIDELRGEVSSLQTADDALRQLIFDLQAVVDALPGGDVNLDSILADIAALQSSLAALNGRVGETEFDIADLQSKVAALAELIGDGGDIDLSGILAEIQALQSDFAALENGLAAEIANREQAIADKQSQLDELNSALANGLSALNNALTETNRVLSGKVTRTAAGITLNPTPLQITEVPLSAFPVLEPPIQWITGATWVSGDNISGTLGVYIGHKDENTIYVQTKTTSGGNLDEIRDAIAGLQEMVESLTDLSVDGPFPELPETLTKNTLYLVGDIPALEVWMLVNGTPKMISGNFLDLEQLEKNLKDALVAEFAEPAGRLSVYNAWLGWKNENPAANTMAFEDWLIALFH